MRVLTICAAALIGLSFAPSAKAGDCDYRSYSRGHYHYVPGHFDRHRDHYHYHPAHFEYHRGRDYYTPNYGGYNYGGYQYDRSYYRSGSYYGPSYRNSGCRY
jgi:hypothetical protein